MRAARPRPAHAVPRRLARRGAVQQAPRVPAPEGEVIPRRLMMVLGCEGPGEPVAHLVVADEERVYAHGLAADEAVAEASPQVLERLQAAAEIPGLIQMRSGA